MSVAPPQSVTTEIRMPVSGMTCASCVGRVERALGKVPGVRGAQYYVQAVDGAGNATTVVRKGGYFRLEDVAVLAPQMRKLYLPVVIR